MDGAMSFLFPVQERDLAQYSQQMQAIFERYRQEVSTDPVDLKQVGAWAIGQKLWTPKPSDVTARFAREMADALREEYRTDNAGRRYRAKIVARKITPTGLPLFEWGDIDDAPRAHVENGIALKRRQIVGDSHQLRLDVDHYNDAHPDEEQIALILDFTDDVAERLMAEGISGDEDDEVA
jgi:hypothetical protein